MDQRMQSTYMTPLMCAAINGHMTTSQVLMERGCDPNITDINDKTALQLASDRGKREVMGFLDRKTLNKYDESKKSGSSWSRIELVIVCTIGHLALFYCQFKYILCHTRFTLWGAPPY